jgi:DnaJ family protein C protein 19
MIPLLVVAGLVGFWAWKKGELRALRFGDIAAVIGGVIAIRLFMKGDLLLPAIGMAGAAYWLWFRQKGDPAPAMTVEEARSLLDVAPGADPATVKSAHRRLVARVHPDVGGSADLTARVNAARDILLGSFRPRV